ncbi:MAG: DUF4476 domain-containing protein [Chitinophagaceae bacterium]|nr:DUF4476 domain-containing protein [Chitinophagaceae bacterium]
MDTRILSSSTYGYIIIGQLTDSTYTISTGFPRAEWPEQNITIAVKETDAGYLLKNFGEKGWGLVNLQNMQVIMAVAKMENKKTIETEPVGDAFSTILAAVVNDPVIAQRVIVKSEALQAGQSSETKPGQKPSTKEAAVLSKVQITRLKYDVTTEGVNIMYLDLVNDVSDTVSVLVPIVKSGTLAEAKTWIEKPLTVQVKDEPQKSDSRFIDMELENPNQKPDSGKIPALVITEKKAKELGINSNCKNFASRDDFLNLRKQMIAIEGYDDMINAARKKFKDNCFTTEQIKNLGSLFMKDEGKYKFYTAAYPYVSDSNNFNTLEKQLTDNYFITKFKAMLQH